MRGLFCEAMVAEALGSDCEIVSESWHPWDIQIGNSHDRFPKRIRIQVKNSARLQQWNVQSGKLSKCQFGLKYRNRPSYFETNFPGVPCEKLGFLCDIFVLCFHGDEDLETANQLDPNQWQFYLAPVAGA